MVIPSIGTLVLVRFPFSDLSRSKLRPAVILADTGRNDWVLCQITSQAYTDPLAIEITNGDLTSGWFRKDSYARPGKLFTANAGIMTKQIGELKSEKLEEIIRAIILLLEKSIVWQDTPDNSMDVRAKQRLYQNIASSIRNHANSA